MIDNNNPPNIPAYVLFGLIFVNFGPLKILPKRIPPTSDDMQINKIINKITLKWISLIPKINIKRNKNKYSPKIIFIKNCFTYFFFKNNLEIFVNSINASEKIIIDIKRYIILFINISISKINKNNPVFIRFKISDFN